MSSDEEGGTPREGGRKKRANHNELERKRRHNQKNTMNDLRDAIPIIQVDKPSTVMILTKAKEYINMLENRAYEQEEEIANLRKKLKLPPNTKTLAAPPSATNSDSIKKKCEHMRRENEELRHRLTLLEREAGQATAMLADKEAKAETDQFFSPSSNFASVDPNLLSAANKVLS